LHTTFFIISIKKKKNKNKNKMNIKNIKTDKNEISFSDKQIIDAIFKEQNYEEEMIKKEENEEKINNKEIIKQKSKPKSLFLIKFIFLSVLISFLLLPMSDNIIKKFLPNSIPIVIFKIILVIILLLIFL